MKIIKKIIYLKVRKVPTKITPQQATIAEKIPVLINVVLLLFIFWKIFIFERCIYISEYTQGKNCQTIITKKSNFFELVDRCPKDLNLPILNS